MTSVTLAHSPSVRALILVLLGTSALARGQQAPTAAEGPALSAPKVSRYVEPLYPPEKQASQETAEVLLDIDIGLDGSVEDVRVATSAGPQFDAAALAAARQLQFEPARLGDEPVPVSIQFRYRFEFKTELVQLRDVVNFEGQVRDRFTQRPLQDVKVELLGQGREALTDPEGLFAFTDVPEGQVTVRLSGATLVTISTEETITRGTRKTVVYQAETRDDTVDEEVVVRAPRLRRQATEVAIRTEEARRVPGTQGDTLKVVQNLPGVARSSFGSGQLVVWGSGPRDTRVNIDGVEIPGLYHVGGLRSTVHSDLVSGIELVPGAYGAEYGRGLGGLVKVETRAPPAEGLHGSVNVDVLDASASVSSPLGNGLRVQVAGRYSHLDRLLAGVVSPRAGDLFPIPQYFDGQLQAHWELGRDERLQGVLLLSGDRLRRTLLSPDPAQVRSQSVDSGFWRAYVRYTRILEDGASLSVVPSVGVDTSRTDAAFGGVPTHLKSHQWRYGLRSTYRRAVGTVATLTLGMDALHSPGRIERVGSLSLPAREGDETVFGQAPSQDVNADAWSSTSTHASPFAVLELRLGSVNVTPGLRASATLLEGDRLLPRTGDVPKVGYSAIHWALEPRLAVSWRAMPVLTFTASAGLYHQPPSPEDMGAVFGNPTLQPERALHASLATSWRILPTLSLDTVAYYKGLDMLVTRSPLASPQVARALVQVGVGQSYGAQLLLRQELAHGFFGWVSYAVSRSERQDGPTRARRLFDHDQTHVLGLVASYQLDRWTFGARFRYATGAPRTPVVGAYYDVRGDQYQPLFGAYNSARLPDFYQLDLRAERDFLLAGRTLNVYLDVQNVTNRQNPEELAYNHDYSARRFITGLPVLPMLGARYEF